jgi:hypothetical protein
VVSDDEDETREERRSKKLKTAAPEYGAQLLQSSIDKDVEGRSTQTSDISGRHEANLDSNPNSNVCQSVDVAENVAS